MANCFSWKCYEIKSEDEEKHTVVAYLGLMILDRKQNYVTHENARKFVK